MTNKLTADEILKITNCNDSIYLVTRAEIETLNRKFSGLATVNEKIDRSRFRDMLADTFGVDDSLIMDRGIQSLTSVSLIWMQIIISHLMSMQKVHNN
jgi:hypothetical protein